MTVTVRDVITGTRELVLAEHEWQALGRPADGSRVIVECAGATVVGVLSRTFERTTVRLACDLERGDAHVRRPR